MIGYLTTTITVDDGYPARIQKVLGPASLAQGEHARVLEQPQLIVTPMVAQIGEVAHFLQSFDVVAWPQLAHRQIAFGFQSASPRIKRCL